jgi:hypothetical protein
VTLNTYFKNLIQSKKVPEEIRFDFGLYFSQGDNYKYIKAKLELILGITKDYNESNDENSYLKGCKIQIKEEIQLAGSLKRL